MSARRSAPYRPIMDRAARIRPILLSAMLVLLALTGGYSRYDTMALLLLRPLLIVIAAWFLLLPPGEFAGRIRALGMLLLALAAIIGMQLIPLSPVIWSALPERAGYMRAGEWIGGSQPWRPLSLVPILTWNSLLALLPAGTMLIAFGRLKRDDMRMVVPALLLLGVASALLGVVQVGAGVGYLYRNFSAGLPTGFFSNRNHQAVFLASLFPALGVWAVYPGGGIPLPVRRIVGVATATLFAVTILITGSRTGLLLTVPNSMLAGWLVLRAPSSHARRAIWPLIGLGLALASLVGVAVFLGRGGGIARFAALDAGTEMRVRAWPVLWDMLKAYLPWGSGFGTFDPVFRIYEPDQLLKQSYFNNAHNDLIELAITGGGAALLLLVLLSVWIIRGGMVSVRDWRRRGATRATPLPLVGGMAAVTWLLASLSDYPLRTPLAGALFALSCCLLAMGGTLPRPAACDRSEAGVGPQGKGDALAFEF